MLRSTFQHLVRGISALKEAELWKKGVLVWEDFERQLPLQQSLFGDEESSYRSPFEEALTALGRADVEYFASRLHTQEHFRIPLAFPERTVFLDIETTGLSRVYDIVTLVGWSYQGIYGALIRGGDPGALRAALEDAQVIVTFNGTLFDLPFLRNEFPDLKIPPVHVDLRFLARRVGLTGGQKAIEEELGVKRASAIAEVAGESAPILWHQYRRGDVAAMRLLIRYNHADVEGMKRILDESVKRLLAQRGFPRKLERSIPRFVTSKKNVRRGQKDSASQSMGVNVPAYEGAVGPAISLGQLRTQHWNEPLRVVGIDLTGSAKKASGWCLLVDGIATTKLIGSDEELISATLEARAHVVSIDCPLSLPKGRLCVSDDDPGRDEFGIMRYSERVLKKRGVNVYPALIPSMQKMTARGIALADRFRKLGLPVIESYPGAAQDIMGIPRKRASLQMLCDGMAEFGVRGDFMHKKLTHDELDAITSAIVGVFFWSGKFEALGEEDDEALIIPDLSTRLPSWHSRRVIGISGAIAAGKTTTAKMFEEKGFSYGRYSMVIESIQNSTNAPASRADLQKVGLDVHEKRGQRWLGRQLLDRMPGSGDVVIDGLRFPEDHAFLTEIFGPAFRHIHIAAPKNLRQDRFQSREGKKSQSLEEADGHPVERNSSAMAILADMTLKNNSTLESLSSQVDRLEETWQRGA